MERKGSRFLTAQWLHLAILNFEIDPHVLGPLVPAGTELDKWQGRTLVSLVGFLFHDARLWGLAIPFHRNFEEVNLRFYVRRRTGEGWRRGVVFVKEYAPRRAVAWIARRVYGENYTVAPMRHRIDLPQAGPDSTRSANYWWTVDGAENHLAVTADGQAETARRGCEQEFVIEHYWAYTGGMDRHTLEYRVHRPRWKIWPAREASFTGDVARLYGSRFVESLSAPPRSAYLVDGSSVIVFKGVHIADDLVNPASTHPFEALPTRYTNETASA